MELKDVLQGMMQQSIAGSQLTDLVIGTVTAASPLEISIDTNMAPLQASVLYLTASVIEKKIPLLQHDHTVTISDTYTGGGSAACGVALGDIACFENGTALPVEKGYIILNRPLAPGDEVLLLRVQGGQKYIVLSRIFSIGG